MNRATTLFKVQQLLFNYAYSVDAGDFETVAKLLSDAKLLDAGGKTLAQGYDEIVKFYTGLIRVYPPENTPKTQHIVSNVMIYNYSTDLVQTRANYSVVQIVGKHVPEVIIAGHYESDFQCQNGDYRFARHKMIPILIGDLSKHLRVNLKDIQSSDFVN